MATHQAITRRQPNPGEREALAQFARLDISLAQLRSRLGGMLEFDFGPNERRLTSYFILAEPGIRIEKQDIQRALDMHRTAQITDNQLADWAAMLLLNDAYDWQGPAEDEIAEALNSLAELRPGGSQRSG